MMSIPLNLAINSLRKNKVRTFLTVLGIVIGIAAVIIVMSAGASIKAFMVDQVMSFGTNFIQVEIKVPTTKKNSTESAMGIATGISITTLKISDAEAIKKIPNINNNYAGMMGQDFISYGNQKKQIMTFGASASFIDIDSTEVDEGRFYTEEEDKSLANVVVLGYKVKTKLFENEDPLGKLVKIGHQKFQVIGVMEERGASASLDMDNMIMLPIRTLQKKLMGIDHVYYIFNQLIDEKLADQTADDIASLLRERHDITDPDKDDFSVTTMKEMMDILNTVVGAITMLLIALASISLLVGGVGIMNIMYVSVSERTYEIGLRKAVGAPKKSILSQFLWEAIVVTLFGAIIGIAIGIIVVFLISVVAKAFGFDWRFIITPSSILLACGFSGAVGLLFGLWPARQAANLDPITALRR